MKNRPISTQVMHIRALRFVLCDLEGIAGGLKSEFGADADRALRATLTEAGEEQKRIVDPLSLSEMPIATTACDDASQREFACERWALRGPPVLKDEDGHSIGVTKEHVRAAYTALRALSVGDGQERLAVSALHLAIGPRPPGDETEGIDDNPAPPTGRQSPRFAPRFWPLLTLIPRVEEIRRELVLALYLADRARAHPSPSHAMRVRMLRGAKRAVSPGDAVRTALAAPDRAAFIELARSQARALYRSSVARFLARIGDAVREHPEAAARAPEPPPVDAPAAGVGGAAWLVVDVAREHRVSPQRAHVIVNRMVAKGLAVWVQGTGKAKRFTLTEEGLRVLFCIIPKLPGIQPEIATETLAHTVESQQKVNLYTEGTARRHARGLRVAASIGRAWGRGAQPAPASVRSDVAPAAPLVGAFSSSSAPAEGSGVDLVAFPTLRFSFFLPLNYASNASPIGSAGA